VLATEPLVSDLVSKVHVAVVIVDPSIEQKIRSKHPPLTADDVRSAIVYGRGVQAVWDDSEEHGQRLIVRASTTVARRSLLT
jgi:hypothetical protein